LPYIYFIIIINYSLKNTQPSSSSSIFDLELESFEVELEAETRKALLSSGRE
jgi:hypothetical protein